VSRALGVIDPGHWTYWKLRKLKALENKQVIFSIIRDPVDRISSIFNYALFLDEKYSGRGPISWIRKFDNINDFVAYGGLNEKIIYANYFLWPQAWYIGDFHDSRYRFLDFTTLNASFEKLVGELDIGSGLCLPHANKTVHMNCALPEKITVNTIRKLYADDYALINDICFL
jgi:hypothetical protein